MLPRTCIACLVCLAAIPLLAACAAPPVRVDFSDYRAAPQKHADDDAIVRTDLATLLANAKLLKGRRVELSGRIDYRGLQIGFNYWHFYLVDDQGHRLRAYEHEYRITKWAWADSMARLASQKNTTVTISGRYEGPDLELDWFDDGTHRVDTDYLPMRLFLPKWFWAARATSGLTPSRQRRLLTPNAVFTVALTPTAEFFPDSESRADPTPA